MSTALETRPAPAQPLVASSNWRESALCRSYDPELWFPLCTTTNQALELAVSICERCPVRRQCAADVIASKESGRPIQYGVWAGVRFAESHSSRSRERNRLARSDAYAQLKAIADGEAL